MRRSFTTRANEKGNVYVDIHGEVGSIADGFGAADAVHEMTYSTSRVQHVHLETSDSLARTDKDGRVHVRTSSQAPFIAKQKLCHMFGLRAGDFHVFTERVGGGFGGKQEMLSEDFCVLGTLKIGRPVKWEFTREEQFIGATTRHQMTTQIRLGARRDGTLTAIEFASSPTPAPMVAMPVRRSRCARQPARGLPVSQQEGGRLRRLHQHGAGRRISRLRRLADNFAIESAIDDLAKKLGRDPFEIRRRNMIRPDDWIESRWGEPSDVGFRQLRPRPVH